jgi:hypothetical protein
MLGALAHYSHMDILGTGLIAVQQDRRVQKEINENVKIIESDPRYLKEDFSRAPIPGRSLELGAHGNVIDDAKDPTTWMVRTAKIRSTDITVTKDGVISMTVEINDKFDLVPPKPEDKKRTGWWGSLYKAVTTVTGSVWHGLLGANKDMKTTASWRTTIYPRREREKE